MLKNKKAIELHASRETRRTREGRVDSLRQQYLVNLRNLSVHRGWTSKGGKIYSKRFDSNCKKDNCPQTVIAYHDCQITEGVRIYCFAKEEELYFSINGEEQLVSTCGKQERNSCYGFMRLGCDDNDSEIQVSRLFPPINDEGRNSFVVVAMANFKMISAQHSSNNGKN